MGLKVPGMSDSSVDWTNRPHSSLGIPSRLGDLGLEEKPYVRRALAKTPSEEAGEWIQIQVLAFTYFLAPRVSIL